MADWQPIETAPKDGTPVDLWCVHFDKDTLPCRKPDMVFVEGAGWRYSIGRVLMDRLENVRTPTHWMPSPAAPSS
jgi:hypothetical protein